MTAKEVGTKPLDTDRRKLFQIASNSLKHMMVYGRPEISEKAE